MSCVAGTNSSDEPVCIMDFRSQMQKMNWKKLNCINNNWLLSQDTWENLDLLSSGPLADDVGVIGTSVVGESLCNSSTIM